MSVYQNSNISCSFENEGSNNGFESAKDMMAFKQEQYLHDAYLRSMPVELSSNEVNYIGVSIESKPNLNGGMAKHIEIPTICETCQLNISSSKTVQEGNKINFSKSDHLSKNPSSTQSQNSIEEKKTLITPNIINSSLEDAIKVEELKSTDKKNKRREIFKVEKLEISGSNLDKSDYRKTLKEVINLLQAWYCLRGKFKRTGYKKIPKKLTAVDAAKKMVKSKKTLDYYQLVIRKCLALGTRIKIVDFLNSNFGTFSQKVLNLYRELNKEDEKKIRIVNKSKELKLRLEHFIWDN